MIIYFQILEAKKSQSKFRICFYNFKLPYAKRKKKIKANNLENICNR